MSSPAMPEKRICKIGYKVVLNSEFEDDPELAELFTEYVLDTLEPCCGAFHLIKNIFGKHALHFGFTPQPVGESIIALFVGDRGTHNTAEIHFCPFCGAGIELHKTKKVRKIKLIKDTAKKEFLGYEEKEIEE